MRSIICQSQQRSRMGWQPFSFGMLLIPSTENCFVNHHRATRQMAQSIQRYTAWSLLPFAVAVGIPELVNPA